LVFTVRSAESRATNVEPHHFEPRPAGLIAVMLVVPLAV
jgi:hypothetical protein